MSTLPAAAAGHNQQPFDVKAGDMEDRAGDKDKDDKDEEDKAGDVEDGASGRWTGRSRWGRRSTTGDHVGSPVANMLVL